MTSPGSSAATERAVRREQRTRTTLAAFLIGLPLGAGVLCLLHFGPFRDMPALRYIKHPIENVEVLMCFCALGALGAKLRGSFAERRACRTEIMPAWDGKTVPIGEATRLLAGLNKLSRRLQNTLMIKRAAEVLDFLCRRGTADDLDDHLRTLSDNDALAMEGSYALTRLITWAIPILGFLGTVLGITGAISGVTPEVLENSLSTVTDGLALAFDATALALALTMVTMFLSFMVERAEQGVLDEVDRFADRELAHRFERTGVEEGTFLATVRRNTDVLLQAVDALVQRQSRLWAQTIEEADRRRAETEKLQQASLTQALEKAMERTVEIHARRLAEMDKQFAVQSSGLMEKMATLTAVVGSTARDQQAALVQITERITAQLEVVTRLQDGEKHLRRLQETLNQNLATLAGAGTFEQALHSLTAAIHLLTARASTPPAASATRLGPRSGAAA